MGILDSVLGKVKVIYQADTTDLKAKVREASGEQKKQAKETLDGLEKQNTALEASIKSWGKVAVGVAAAGAAVAAGAAAIGSYFDRAKVEAAAAGANLEKLRAASGGLKTDTELLEFAAASLNTTRKLSNEQMELALQASRSLVKQGNDEVAVFQAIKKAVVEGSVEPLKQFGVVVQEVSGKQEKFNQLIEALGEQAQAFGGDFEMVGDSIERMGTRAQNVWDDLKIGIGEVVFDVLNLDNAVEDLLYSEENAARNAGLMKARLAAQAAQDELDEQFKRVDLMTARIEAIQRSQMSDEELAEYLISTGENVNSVAGQASQVPFGPAPKSRGGGRGRDSRIPKYSVDASLYEHMGSVDGAGWAQLSGDFERGRIGEVAGLASGLVGDDPYGDQIKAMIAARDEALESVDGEEGDFLSQLFGPPSRFEELQQQLALVSSAATSSFEAWKNGSIGAKEAMTGFAASVVGNWASMMFAQGWKDIGAGWSAAANPVTAWQAPLYYASAAKNFAGSVVLGGVARAMGGRGGGGTASGAGGGGGGGGGGGAAAAVPDRNITVNIGHEFGGMSRRERDARARAEFERINRDSSGTSITGSD